MKYRKHTIINSKCIRAIFLFLLITFFTVFLIPVSVEADDPIVIVIDPGHGGENLGAQYDGYTEKDMTMIVAKAMKEELEKYDGVVVYLTHETDQDMSIKDRAVFAKERNADFLFCLHFNSSVEHTLFGAEVWVPASGEYYAKGYSFAQVEMKELTDIGLYSRGIKTRLNDQNENYYGILRYCTSEGVPSALIEHCHLDQDKDKRFYQQGDEQLELFGRLDATAVAKYFGLKSEVLGIDYSEYPVPETDIPSDIVRPDKTGPDLCRIEVEEINRETGEVSIRMEAEDTDSFILYYSYSIDGGATYILPEEWPRPEAWNRSSKNIQFTIAVPFGEQIELLAKASNAFDVWTESNMIEIDPIKVPEPPIDEVAETQEEENELGEAWIQEEKAAEEEGAEEEETEEETIREEEQAIRPEVPEVTEMDRNTTNKMLIIVIIIALILCMFFVSFFMAKTISLLIKGNKKQ